AANCARGSVSPAARAWATAAAARLPSSPSNWSYTATNSSFLPPKWWYRLPTLEPARRTISATLASANPCSPNTARAASRNPGRVATERLCCRAGRVISLPNTVPTIGAGGVIAARFWLSSDPELPGDEHLLHLRGALADLQNLGVPVEPRHRELVHE